MSKYAPLGEYLKDQKSAEVPMTFKQIERIIGMKLPHSQFNRAWWSNNPENNVMTGAWLEAKYISTQVDIKAGTLVFRRIGTRQDSPRTENVRKRIAKRFPDSSGKESKTTGRTASSKNHPLIGWMKGTMTIAPGVDLTEPADPEWGKRIWGDQK